MQDKNIHSKHKCINCGGNCEFNKLKVSVSVNMLESPLDTFTRYQKYLQHNNEIGNLEIRVCSNCGMYHIYKDNIEIYPGLLDTPEPHQNMPDTVKEIYNESREIFSKSPRAAAALLRLGLQILCKELGEKGKDINNDIHKLHEKGLDQRIINSLDIVRVIGNEAVHPGEIDLNDNKEIALNLFNIMNMIIEDTIASKIRNTHIEEMYRNLPQSKLNAIKYRDK
ncbi:DUF4145 domain-containing protein [Intestinibacter bartlettii]|uniref:DUF4145 domain-containing protein n=2 Tax=Intestinibacter bartlettii TaxID=261299 RepID=A0ABS8CVH9_9FIRM|nr:DUF4145 domain-containing protein [Intestinibacter bartlettii]MCB5396102.1 DUF4145 domain-containing protein [Intestinibacter bartlettii]MCB5402651.1 DUF4145 domain-containing protein [Intestinibacter bartlettii]MCB5444907.1 DUF4145 domain-containing protein [Intestinibacter bartlettii]MCB5719542.1 DUF4145 domain-containing protein [Intestinibacter bartlettii]MCB5747479.1 DUF4145 domain-containing protein [Intestinibacter bartlettii]